MTIDDNRRSREALLARVRTALRRDGPDDAARAAGRAAAQAYLAAHRSGPRPALSGDIAGRFLRRATDMSSSVERIATFDEAPSAVLRYLKTVDALPAAGVCWPEFAAQGWAGAGLDVESRPTVGHDALGITGCFCAIAETGTLVLVSGAQTPTATFLLPETHVAIVRTDRIVPAMEDAFALLRAEGALPRGVSLVSGPSRTGDIEQTTVLGAHGPRRLHILLVGQ